MEYDTRYRHACPTRSRHLHDRQPNHHPGWQVGLRHVCWSIHCCLSKVRFRDFTLRVQRTFRRNGIVHVHFWHLIYCPTWTRDSSAHPSCITRKWLVFNFWVLESSLGTPGGLRDDTSYFDVYCLQVWYTGCSEAASWLRQLNSTPCENVREGVSIIENGRNCGCRFRTLRWDWQRGT